MKKCCLPTSASTFLRIRFLTILWLSATLSRAQSAAAQAPALPVKATLGQSLLSGKIFSGGSGVDTVTKNFSGSGAYTLELVAKVNSASGRGLDIEGRNAKLDGFRLSLDAANLKFTSSLAAAGTLTASQAAQNHTIRIAVNGDTAHMYQNGAYLLSQPLSLVKDLVNGVETDAVANAAYGANLTPAWAGLAGNNSGAPNTYGWAYTGTTVTNLFNTANSGSGVRYIDVTATTNPHTYNGNAYTGRVLYIRWDNSAYQNAVFSYPVTLEANTTYNFSWLYSLTANNSGSQPITVGIGKTVYSADRAAAKTFYTTTTLRDLKKDNFIFTSQDSGTYYITINGNFALYSIAELSVNKFSAAPRFVLGKNYPAGAVNAEIVSATYENGAYAPAALVTNPRQTVTLTGNQVQLPTSFNTDFIVPGKTDVHFTAESTPYSNASIALNTADSWLFFDHVRPAAVIAGWLGTITVSGAAAVNNSNVRIAVYKDGTAIIPNGNRSDTAALQVFTQPGGAGTTNTYAIETIHNNLGAFNNSIRSFRLKRGYMATFANSPDGSGYSRVFIANDSDMVVNAMPAGLDTAASFIRVMRWNWPSKKGKAGWDPGKLNATWYYDWNIAGNSSSPNYDYGAIRQSQYWPAFSSIINKGNVNHISGYNEPDRPDQANLTVEEAFSTWPQMMQVGLRTGSPSPANPESSWITDFLRKCDSFNYRVDYVTIHCYWGGQTPAQWYNRLKAIYDRVKRPLWITEWNNGANWTTETWPTDQASQFQKQLNDMKGILQVLDTASFVERYAEYDWVENKRALVLADTLTPAGRYYAASKSDFAYNPSRAFVHTWKLVASRLTAAIADSDYFRANISFADLNGETGSRYILERKIDGRDTGFLAVQTYSGYPTGTELNFADSVYGKASYRLKAFGKDGTTFVYSGTLDVVRDAAPVAPSGVTGTIISSSRTQVAWNTAAAARSYNLKRSLSATGPWTTIQARTTTLTYRDTALIPATTYYYAVTALNSAGESANSTVLSLTTPALAAPAAVLNPHVASGDTRTILTWDFQYDATYKILRSAAAAGPYDTIATGVTALRYVDYGRANNTTYYYTVVAYNPVGTSAPTAVLAATPRAGQRLYTGFDDTTSAFAEDVWGGYHATLSAAAVRDTGYVSHSLKMDGTAASYATLGEGVTDSLYSFTVAAWVKMTALSNWMRIFDFGTGASRYMFLTPQASVNATVSTIRYAIKNGGAEQTLSYGYTWPLNTWTHLAVTQSNDTVRLYINGVLVASTAGITIKPADLGVTTLNYIGKSQFGADPGLKGMVDEFKIFNDALGARDIANLVNGRAVLPLRLLSMEGRIIPQGNLLSWKIANTTVIRMELEKSPDAGNFTTIYSVAAASTGSASSFNYTDAALIGAVSYYRLKMTDVDGTVSYSPVVAITNRSKGLTVVGLYPSVVSGNAVLKIVSANQTTIRMVITDMYGRSVRSSFSMLAAGSHLLQVDAAELAAGAYTITVYDANGRAGSVRFVVGR